MKAHKDMIHHKISETNLVSLYSTLFRYRKELRSVGFRISNMKCFLLELLDRGYTFNSINKLIRKLTNEKH